MSQPYILVINDHTVVSMVTVRILNNHGYHVDAAKDGRAALKFIEKQTLDLIILDIQMPDMDGVEVVATMKEFVPFLIQSSLPDDDPRVVTLMECGALGRVSTKSLLAEVERALSV